MEAGAKAAVGNVAMGADSSGNAQPLQVDSAGNLKTAWTPLPSGATPLMSASGNVAAAAATATLAGAANQTTYITGFELTGAGATAASVIALTITGLLGGTATYNVPVPAGAAVGIQPLIVEFPEPMPASAVNTSIVVSAASFGAGNTNAAVVAHGFRI